MLPTISLLQVRKQERERCGHPVMLPGAPRSHKESSCSLALSSTVSITRHRHLVQDTERQKGSWEEGEQVLVLCYKGSWARSAPDPEFSQAVREGYSRLRDLDTAASLSQP